jgi:hypothetical protein
MAFTSLPLAQQCKQRERERKANSTAISSAYFLSLRKESKPIKDMKNSAH